MVNPSKIAFTLFERDIHWFAVLLLIGGIAALVVSCINAKRRGVSFDEVVDMCLWALPLAVIGARIYFVLFNLHLYASDPISALYFWEGGLALPGAVLGGMLGVFIYSRIKKHRFLSYMDVLIPGLALAQAIGRWGDFFNQTSYGPLITNPAHLIFPLGVLIDATGTCHYAAFFYESVWCFLIFLFVLALGKRFKHDGDALIAYLMLYSLERTLVEQLRVDSIMLGDIRVTQLLCAVVFVATLGFVIVRAIREKRAGRLLWPAPVLEPSTAYAEPQPVDINTAPSVDELVNTSGFQVDDTALLEFGVSPDIQISDDAQLTQIQVESPKETEEIEEIETFAEGEVTSPANPQEIHAPEEIDESEQLHEEPTDQNSADD